MKTRNGFVSNSSSSSFIIGIAFVPGDRIAEVEKKLRWGVDDLMNKSEVMSSRHYDAATDTVEQEAFNWQTVRLTGVSKLFEKDPDGAVLRAYFTGDEPQYDEDSWEYNYDEVDESTDWFTSEQLAGAELIRELGGETDVGAGFNG